MTNPTPRKRTTITIATQKGRIDRPAYLTPCAGVAAHRALGGLARWTLTHAESGKGIAFGDTYAEVYAFASRLAETGFDWGRIDRNGKGRDATARREMIAAYKRAKPAHGNITRTALETSLRPIEADPMRKQIDDALNRYAFAHAEMAKIGTGRR